MSYAFAATRLVNPPGVEPVITEEQMFKGLEYKARNPAVFREITVGGSILKEEIELHAATIAYFEMNTGQRVTNVISYGPADEMLLTYSFSNGIPGIPADKPKPSASELNAMVGKALDRSIGIVRQMVQDGKL